MSGAGLSGIPFMVAAFMEIVGDRAENFVFGP